MSGAPIVAVLAIALVLTLTGHDSFAATLGVLGVVTNTVFTGLIPVLLLTASRRKGEVVPAHVVRFLGFPPVLGGIYLLYLAILLLHGFVIWHDPLERVAATGTAVGVVIATAVMIRQGALTQRAVVELRKDTRAGQPWAFAVTSKGEPATVRASVHAGDRDIEIESSGDVLPDISGIDAAAFELPAIEGGDIKVWAHVVSPDGASEALPSKVAVASGETHMTSELRGAAEQVVLPLQPGRATVWITADE